MRTVGESIKYVSQILGDQQFNREFKVFTKPFLRMAYYEALTAIASQLPDLLAFEVTMTLKAGDLQDSPCVGGTVEPLEGGAQEVPASAIASVPTPVLFTSCASGYSLRFYANMAGGKYLRVSPAVKGSAVGTKYKMLCKGKVPPLDLEDDTADTSNLPPDAIQIIHDWMLYRAFLVDDQDIHSNAEADRAYNRLTARLGKEYLTQMTERQKTERNQ